VCTDGCEGRADRPRPRDGPQLRSPAARCFPAAHRSRTTAGVVFDRSIPCLSPGASSVSASRAVVGGAPASHRILKKFLSESLTHLRALRSLCQQALT